MALITCSACNGRVSDQAQACPHCGHPTLALGNPCPDCGGLVPSTAASCPGCGRPVMATPRPRFVQPYAQVAQPSGPSGLALHGLSPYYEQEFRQIAGSNESYKGKWNWAAFLFGPLWALTKGAWLAAIICIVLCVLTIGILGIPYWFVFGARGNYLYYCASQKRQQLVV